MKWFNTKINKIWRVNVFHEDSLQMINFKMKCLEITTYAITPMKQCVWKSSLLVRWSKNFIIGENSTKCWFSVTLVTNLPIVQHILMSKKWKRASISLFNSEFYVLVFRGQIFMKRVGRFRWFKGTKTWTYLL